MNNISLTKGVYYVGAVDWDQRDFHGYATGRGVTYNSYLIVDEKKLIDYLQMMITLFSILYRNSTVNQM